jgi:ADP-ribose pyrophosphatase YjhB (NUDIX family)
MLQTRRLSEKQWNNMVRWMPIPCVDVIVQKCGQILVGFRAIIPYKNVWALPGGRILKNENPEDAVRRNLTEIGISANTKRFVGAFSVRFPNHPQRRHDITLCYESEWRNGEPKPTPELTRFKWISPNQALSNMGANYRKMILKAHPQPKQRKDSDDYDHVSVRSCTT